MPKIAKTKTATQVAGIRKPGKHTVGGAPGLRLRVTPTGHRSWVVITMVAGKRVEYQLGHYDGMTLPVARNRATLLRARIAEGANPAGEKRARLAEVRKVAEADTWTFRACAEAARDLKSESWTGARQAESWTRSLEQYVFPLIGDRPAREIDVAAVVEVLQPIWFKIPETARKVRQRISTAMEFAAARGFAPTNPVDAAVSLLAPQKDKVEHLAALTHDAVPALMERLASAPGGAATALRFAILTAVRSGDVRGMVWDEVNFEAATWTVPAERMKARVEHVVPLSRQALDILHGQPRVVGTDLVFPSLQTGRAMSDMTLLSVLRRMGVKSTVHGFRSSFKGFCEVTGVQRSLSERALAHAVKDQVERAYNRVTLIEQRRPVMQDWATYVTT